MVKCCDRERGGEWGSGRVCGAEEWEAMLSTTSAAQPVVVDFSAPRCAPCAAIAPFFAELAGRYAVGLQ